MMRMSHKVLRMLFAFGVGFAIAIYAYLRVTDPEPAIQRAREERVVVEARQILREVLPIAGGLEMVDPLAPDRKVGKVYIYPSATGWEVSGYYRRGAGDRWHPWLMKLDGELRMRELSVKDADAELRRLAASDHRLTVVP